MVYKDKNMLREYQRIWARNKKLGLPTKSNKVRQKQTPEERKRQRKICARRWEIKIKSERDKIFGTKCGICSIDKSSRIRIFLHRKNGVKHEHNIKMIREAISEPEKWIMLCGKCHTGVHFCMKHFKIEWDDIVRLAGLHS